MKAIYIETDEKLHAKIKKRALKFGTMKEYILGLIKKDLEK